MVPQPDPSATLLAYTASPDFLAQRNVTARFLSVLAFLYRQHPYEFEAVQQIRGTRRAYFAMTAEEIERGSRNACPRQIQESTWWVQTNLNLPGTSVSAPPLD